MASRQAIAKLTKDIFGALPIKGIRTGNQFLKKRHTAVLENRYYVESIDSYARKFMPGYLNEQEERRQMKLEQLRRRGKGPPKKGSGKRSKRK